MLNDRLASAGVTFLERGWLSANNVIIRGDGRNAVVDTGYASHAEQTVALIRQALGAEPLHAIINTHLHSDHCGGNAALQDAYPLVETHIPPGQADAVRNWDPHALSYTPTGQVCPRFKIQGLLSPGESVQLGSHAWEVHAAKGHDPHAVVLFEPKSGILISGDALWENGFGVVFPELEGIGAFHEVAETLDVIEQLAPSIIIPGHGQVFDDLALALKRARSRLEQFLRAPEKHHRYAIKVLIKYRLLEWQQIPFDGLLTWAEATPYLQNSMPGGLENSSSDKRSAWLQQILGELETSGALTLGDGMVTNR